MGWEKIMRTVKLAKQNKKTKGNLKTWKIWQNHDSAQTEIQISKIKAA